MSKMTLTTPAYGEKRFSRPKNRAYIESTRLEAREQKDGRFEIVSVEIEEKRKKSGLLTGLFKKKQRTEIRIKTVSNILEAEAYLKNWTDKKEAYANNHAFYLRRIKEHDRNVGGFWDFKGHKKLRLISKSKIEPEAPYTAERKLKTENNEREESKRKETLEFARDIRDAFKPEHTDCVKQLARNFRDALKSAGDDIVTASDNLFSPEFKLV